MERNTIKSIQIQSKIYHVPFDEGMSNGIIASFDQIYSYHLTFPNDQKLFLLVKKLLSVFQGLNRS